MTGRIGCIDVGGSTIKSAVLVAGSLVDVRHSPTPARGDDVAERVVDRVVEIVEAMPRDSGALAAVGLVVPGLVDSAAGVGLHSENLGWRDVPFRALVEERLGLPVAFGHDVGAGGVAEARLGAGAAYRDIVFLPVGTGISAAVVHDGVALERSRPIGEIGHVDVGHDEVCVCGLRGCLEAVASAAAIGRRYAARTGVSATAAQVAERVAAGDPAAQAVWADAVAGLGRAVAILAAVLAPDAVVLGGGLAAAGPLLLDPLREDVAGRLSFHHRPDIVPSQLGDLAGCLGAGLLARDLIEGDGSGA